MIRASAVVLLLAVLGAGPAQAARPAPPAGVPVLKAGQLPHQCGTGDASETGTYFDEGVDQWLSAPNCYAVWGNLEASPPRLANAGQTVTVTATPNQGSNSATYAPQTKSIRWDPVGKFVSGCGNADLSCTLIPAAKATDSWQWVQVHVTMPRTFFINSPGSNCAGIPICGGVGTNAWSWIGVRPKSLTPGIIRGRVVDPDGDAMPGVRVTASGPGSRTASTGANGRYELTLNRPGRYTVKASNGAGFFVPRSTTVQVRKGSTAKADFKLGGCSGKASAAKSHRYGGGPSRIGRFTATWDDCGQDVEVNLSGRVTCLDGVGADTGDPTSPPVATGSDFIALIDAEWSFKAESLTGNVAHFDFASSTKVKVRGRLEPDGKLSPLPGVVVTTGLAQGSIRKGSMEFQFSASGDGKGPGGRTLCRFPDANGRVVLTAR